MTQREVSHVTIAVGVLVAGSTYADVPRGAAEPPYQWASETGSPRPLDDGALSDGELELQRDCGAKDAGLHAVALRLVERKLAALPYVDTDGLVQALRVAGEPHVWPHAWVVSGRALERTSTREKLRAWVSTFHEPGERRCGVALGYALDGTEVIAAVAVAAAADLAPLPIHAHVGGWLSVDAKLLIPATAARVVIVGPTGPPRTVPSQFHDDHVRAQIAPDQAGAFTVQVVADVATGPRPVLEADLFADTTPWTRPPDPTAPGENAAAPDPSDRSALLAMVAALRSSDHLSVLHSDPRLDSVAAAHVARMVQLGTVGHDLGNGDPRHRIEAAGIRARQVGENVAKAASVALAHRSLYASPSHRANLLSPAFDSVGVAVARDPDGSVWVAEEFAGGER